MSVGSEVSSTPTRLARLLLVEDDELQREAMQATLAGSGFSVSACGRADHAVHLFSQSPHDVVVIDLRLPDADGIVLTERLRAIDPHVGILIVTMFPGVHSAVSAMRSGATDFIVKPVSSADLALSVQSALNERETRRSDEARRMALEARLQAIEEVNSQLNEFAARVAHDLRSPVRATQLWIEFAREAVTLKNFQEADDYLNSALRSIGSGSGIIDGLLALSKSSLLPLKPSCVSLEPMIQSIVEACRVEFQPRTFDARVEVVGQIYADVVLIGIALSNVIHNAFKYCSTQPEPMVEIFAGPSAPGLYAITVRDNGIGIPSSQIERIFRPFERLSSAKGFSGEGIGLTTVKRVLDKHGASVSIQSVEGDGTTVVMSFPNQAIESNDLAPDAIHTGRTT
jgi:two-component system sensor histidine kinase/response regulator